MVRFEKDRYVIEADASSPVEDWMGLHEELVFLISLVDSNNSPAEGLQYVPQLLGDMMPSWETARKMVD